jgi:hypothetical protein
MASLLNSGSELHEASQTPKLKTLVEQPNNTVLLEF